MLAFPVLAASALALLASWPTAPAAAQAPSLADRLCSLDPRGARARPFPNETGLDRTAAEAEQDLRALRARGDPSAATAIDLDTTLDGSAAPSDAALARYCAAAGETRRLGAAGSQLQALTWLLTAYRRASRAGETDLAARAAYRLALVGISDPAVAGTRGGEAAGAYGEELDGPAGATLPDACAALGGLGLAGATVRGISAVALDCAAALSPAGGDPELAALANLRLARFEGEQALEPGADRDALRSAAAARAAAALPYALAIPSPSVRAELTGRLVDTFLDQGGAPGDDVAAAVAALSGTGDPRQESLVAGLAGRLALAHGDSAAARAAFEAAILAESRRPLPVRLPLHYLRLAEADPPNRARHVQAAYTALDNLRPLLPRFDPLTEETSFALYLRDVFIAAVELELADPGADEPVRIRRAQQIVEAYRQAELQSAFGSECLPPRAAASPDALLPGEIILYPLLLQDRVELLYVTAGDGQGGVPRYRRLTPNRDHDRARVARLVEELVLAMRLDGSGDWQGQARALYDLLIGPIADQLGPDSMLAIVPDGPLRALPFAALVAPDGRFLVQQARLSLIPALAYSEPDGARTGDRLNVVAASLQREISLPVGTFPELAGTAEEARIAVEFADRGRLVPDFTRAELVGALGERRIDVLHLATHAAFNGRSDRAFVVANGEVIRLSELREMIARSRTRGETLDLIVLSACETAVGDDETSLGLAGAAVQAGARSVIGSLWQVSDVGTAQLMTRFYRSYSAGRSRSAALRDAQLGLIAAGGDLADPGIWAGFALLGAWR